MAISVQSGVAIVTSDDQDVTITAVDLDHSYVLVDSSTATTAASSGFQSWSVTAVLSDSTTLRLQRDGGVADAEVVWQVVTCDAGEFVTLTRGDASALTGNATDTVTVAEGDPNRTMLVYSVRGNFTTADSNLGFITGVFTTPTLLTFERGGTSTTRTNVRFEVVEWSQESGVTVTSGLSTVNANAGSGIDFAHGATVTTDNTFLYSQSRHEDNGLEQCSMRVSFDSTNITADRFDTTNAYTSHVAWQLITFPADICQKKTPVTGLDTTTQIDTTVSTIDVDKTIVWSTNNTNGQGASMGRNAWNVQVIDSTTIQSNRSYSGQLSELFISICDFSGLDHVQFSPMLGHT